MTLVTVDVSVQLWAVTLTSPTRRLLTARRRRCHRQSAMTSRWCRPNLCPQRRRRRSGHVSTAESRASLKTLADRRVPLLASPSFRPLRCRLPVGWSFHRVTTLLKVLRLGPDLNPVRHYLVQIWGCDVIFSRPYLSSGRALSMVVIHPSVTSVVHLSRMYCG